MVTSALFVAALVLCTATSSFGAPIPTRRNSANAEKKEEMHYFYKVRLVLDIPQQRVFKSNYCFILDSYLQKGGTDTKPNLHAPYGFRYVESLSTTTYHALNDITIY